MAAPAEDVRVAVAGGGATVSLFPKTKDRVIARQEDTVKAMFAQEVAAAIEASTAPCLRLPLCDRAWCPVCDRSAYATGLAAMVRRMGGVG
jgi:hypothetical protein